MKSGLLVRISFDRDDDRVGVTRQEADARALAARRGDEVTKVYVENDTSAYKRRKVTLPDGTRALRVIRPSYRQALADLADGTIEVLICYDLDRMVRDPRDLEDLIDVCETNGRTAVAVTGSLQLDNTAGITMARVGVAMANQSSRDTARRVTRARQAAADEGRWGGGGRRAFGFTPDRTAAIPAEAAAVASISRDILACISLREIARRLDAGDVPTVSGLPWTPHIVRKIAVRPANAGLLSYRGEVVGKAPWPALVDESIWRQVCAELSERTPRVHNTMKYWLSGILICSYCQSPLRGNAGRYFCASERAGRNVRCQRTSIQAPIPEQALAALVIAAASRVREQPAPAVSLVPDDNQLAELAELWGSREITLAEYRAARAKILERTQPPPPPRLPSWTGPALADEWDSLTPAAKRRIADALLEGVIVNPAVRGGKTLDRLEVHWR